MIGNILSRIANGDLHTTPEYSSGVVPKEDYLANQKRFDELCEICDLIEDKYVTGNKDETKNQPYYTNLRLTESGKKMHRFLSLKLEDIDNAHGKNSAKEWFAKPLIVAAAKYILIGFLALIGGAYSSDIKQIFASIVPLQSPSEQIDTSSEPFKKHIIKKSM